MNTIKFVFIFIFCTLVIVLFNFMPILNLFSGGLNYIFTGTLGDFLINAFKPIGTFFDFLFLNSENSYTLSNGVVLSNFVWVGTIMRVVLTLILIKIFVGVIQ